MEAKIKVLKLKAFMKLTKESKSASLYILKKCKWSLIKSLEYLNVLRFIHHKSFFKDK